MLETTVYVLAVIGLGTVCYWLVRLARCVWLALRPQEDWSVEDIMKNEG